MGGGHSADSAAYPFHLCQDHPFADGNKRTALAAAEVLLNDMQLVATDQELEEVTLGVAASRISTKETIGFLHKQSCKTGR